MHVLKVANLVSGVTRVMSLTITRSARPMDGATRRSSHNTVSILFVYCGDAETHQQTTNARRLEGRLVRGRLSSVFAALTTG